MAITYEPIATQTLASATTTITFSSIPSTYTDLILISSIIGDSGSIDAVMRFNGDSGTNYSETRLFGDGAAVYANRSTARNGIDVNYGGNISIAAPITSTISIMNYANTTTYKAVLMRSADVGGTYQATNMLAGLWRGSTGSATQAITSVSVVGSGNMKIGSMFTLYGIKAA
jgi:hypothetical protein